MGEDCHPRPCRSAAAVAVGIGGAASLVVAAGALPASPKTLWCANCLQLTPTARISRPAGRLSTAPVGRAARRLLGVLRRPPGGACLAASVLAACPCLPRRPSSPPWRSRPSAARVARCPAFVSRQNANWQKTWALCQLNWQTTSYFARLRLANGLLNWQNTWPFANRTWQNARPFANRTWQNARPFANLNWHNTSWQHLVGGSPAHL